MKRTVIIGAGSWGTALAALWAKDGRPIALWGNNPDRITRVQETRENIDYLPGVRYRKTFVPRTTSVTAKMRTLLFLLLRQWPCGTSPTASGTRALKRAARSCLAAQKGSNMGVACE